MKSDANGGLFAEMIVWGKDNAPEEGEEMPEGYKMVMVGSAGIGQAWE